MDAHQCLPFYHPTTVVYVDDDGELLHLLPPAVGALPYRCFTSPGQLLSALGRRELLPEVDLNCWERITGQIGDPDTHGALILDKWMIYLRLFNPRRFDLMSVLVVDYRMPGMSGLTLCQRLAQLPCKKLMLTGQGDTEMAVQALNDDLIDMYLTKSQPDLDLHVARAIERLQRRYFADSARMVGDFLRQDDKALWGNAVLGRLLRQHCADRGIAEYYAISDPRGFLLVTAEGEANLWLVFSDAEIEAHCFGARALGAPAGVLAQLEGRQAIVFIGDFEGQTVLDARRWWNACLPLTPVPGSDDLYYCTTGDAAPFRISRDSVRCYADFLGSVA